MTRLGVVRLPTSLGRFRVASIIAEGGMGVVYRGIDPDTNEPVALKTVAGTRLLNLACLRREIFALSRVRHPGIVRIREQGIDRGVPWCAMDLVEGTPFRRFFTRIDAFESTRARIDAFEDTRTAGPAAERPIAEPLRGEPLLRVLETLRRLCPPLAFLHAEGIVHRDIKPENIVVRPSGDPVIIDFGLASQLGGQVSRDAISGEAHAEVGTFGYMAPEQQRGELHDARADLYALGCMLYEALTGRLPLGASPPRPAALAKDVDPTLDALAMRLLADDPRDRLGYVEDIAIALEPIVGPLPQQNVAPRTYLYRPSFAGRDDAVARVSQWLDESKGGLALLRGESGVGKTRLVMEVARQLARQRVHVITAECIPVAGTNGAAIQAAPLHPLRPVLRAIADYCRVGGPDIAEQILGRRAHVLAAFEPDLLGLTTAAHQEPEALAPQAARARLYADLGDAIASYAQRAPFVLIVDDLQWSDELTATFFATHAQQLREWGLRLIGTCRSEAIDESLEELSAAADITIDIGRLSGVAVSAMVSDMLAIPSPPDTLVQFMHSHSEGNPFFVSEYLRAAVERGWLARDRAGKWQVTRVDATTQSLPLPRSLRELVTQRLDDLSDVAARFVEGAAVLGREVDSAVLSEMLRLDDTTAIAAIEELVRRQVLDETAADQLRFSHDKLREVAYERLELGPRRELHHRAAACLEQTRGDDPAVAGVLAHHFLQAGQDARAIDYLELAGEHALASAAHGQARQFFGHALALPVTVDSLRRSRWMRRVSEAAFGQGDIEQSEAQATETLSRLTGGLPSTRVGWLSLIAKAVARQGLGWASPRARAARSEDERARSLEAALTAGQLASTYYFTGDALRMVGTLLLGVNLADRAGSPSAVVESYARLAYIAGVGGLHRAANHYFTRALALAGAHATTTDRALTLYLQAFYHLGLAQWSAAEREADLATELLVATGDRQSAEIAQTIAAHAVYFSGRFTEARVRYAHVLESARARGNIQHEAWGLFLRARSDLALGDVELAIGDLERAREALASVADQFSTVICHGLLAQAYLARRDLAAAERAARALHEHTAGLVPMAACVDGYVGAADVSLALAERARYDSRRRTAAHAAARQLARFARAFPMARAAAQRVKARLDLLDGNVSSAVQALRRSVDSARGHGMPYDEALAHALLARVELTRERAREHDTAAQQLFTRLQARRASSGLTD